MTPCRDPAKVSVAPNSPSERANASTAPDTTPGNSSGRVTRHQTVVGRAPSVAATTSKSAPAVRAAPSSEITRNGSDTNVCASTTAVVLNATLIPAASR